MKLFTLTMGALFSLIAVGHALRLLFGWQVTIDGRLIPMWLSWVGIAIAAFLAYQGFRLSRKLQ